MLGRQTGVCKKGVPKQEFGNEGEQEFGNEDENSS